MFCRPEERGGRGWRRLTCRAGGGGLRAGWFADPCTGVRDTGVRDTGVVKMAITSGGLGPLR